MFLIHMFVTELNCRVLVGWFVVSKYLSFVILIYHLIQLYREETLYHSGFHKFSLLRSDLWTLNKDEWVNCFVVNSWVNCLNWNQRGQMKKLVTRYVNHVCIIFHEY